MPIVIRIVHYNQLLSAHQISKVNTSVRVTEIHGNTQYNVHIRVTEIHNIACTYI